MRRAMMIGREQVLLELPEAARELASDRSGWPGLVGELDGAVTDALEAPLDGPPLADRLARGDRVSLIVDDHTRTTPTARFLPPLVHHLEGLGIPKGDMQVVMAHGVHRAATPREIAGVLGPDLADLQVVVHDARGPMDDLGTTSRGTPVRINQALRGTRIILTGDVELHYFAGYGGARKSLIPGVAAWETVEANHRLMLLRPGSALGELAGVAVHEDMEEAARLAGPCLTLNVVRSPDGGIVGVLAGSMEAVLRRGAEMVDRMYKVPVAGRFDLVVCDMGGAPRDRNFFQAWKAVESALRAVRPGGTVLLCAACDEGWGNDGYQRIMDELSLPPRGGRWLDADLASVYGRTRDAVRERLLGAYVNGGNKAYFQLAALARVDLLLLSRIPSERVDRYQMIPVEPEDVAPVLAAKHSRDDSVLIIRDAGTWLPVAGGGEDG